MYQSIHKNNICGALTVMGLAVIIPLLLLAPPAQAKSLTCDELVAGLEGKGTPNTDYGAIILGVVQTAAPRVCVPNGTMLATLKAVFVHWADQHQKEMGTEAWGCAAKAFAKAFPCAVPR